MGVQVAEVLALLLLSICFVDRPAEALLSFLGLIVRSA